MGLSPESYGVCANSVWFGSVQWDGSPPSWRSESWRSGWCEGKSCRLDVGGIRSKHSLGRPYRRETEGDSAGERSNVTAEAETAVLCSEAGGRGHKPGVAGST